MSEIPPTPVNSPANSPDPIKSALQLFLDTVLTHETICWHRVAPNCNCHHPQCMLAEPESEEARMCFMNYLADVNNYKKFISNYNELGYNWNQSPPETNPQPYEINTYINFDDTMEEIDSSENDSECFAMFE